MLNKRTNEISDIFWLHYMELIQLFQFYDKDFLKRFASINISDYHLPPYINNIYNLFYYNYYSGDIYKEQTVYTRELSDYKIENNNEPDLNKIEALNIEWEHYLWVNWKSYFNSKKRD